LVTAAHALQDASGVSTSPVRTYTVTPHPAGTASFQVTSPHCAGHPASKTEEISVPAISYKGAAVAVPMPFLGVILPIPL